MKKIINGKLYNTDTAKKIAEWSTDLPLNDNAYYTETLYRKRTGEYFTYGEGGPASKYAESYMGSWIGGDAFTPLTPEQAEQEASEHLDAEEYEKIFGPVNEGEQLKDIHVQVSEKQYAELKEKASENGVSMREVVNQALNAFLE